MTTEEAKRRLLNIERSIPNTFRTKEDVRNFEALEMAIKALEQNESAEEWYKLFVEKLEQEPKEGHWIKSNIPNEKYVCSECGGGCWYYDYQADVVKSRFCPNCGAKMKGEAE